MKKKLHINLIIHFCSESQIFEIYPICTYCGHKYENCKFNIDYCLLGISILKSFSNMLSLEKINLHIKVLSVLKKGVKGAYDLFVHICFKLELFPKK